MINKICINVTCKQGLTSGGSLGQRLEFLEKCLCKYLICQIFSSFNSQGDLPGVFWKGFILHGYLVLH